MGSRDPETIPTSPSDWRWPSPPHRRWRTPPAGSSTSRAHQVVRSRALLLYPADASLGSSCSSARDVAARCDSALRSPESRALANRPLTNDRYLSRLASAVGSSLEEVDSATNLFRAAD